MRLLLDTHALLWWLYDDDRLSLRAREVIAVPTHVVYVSSASAWEMATKYRIGKLPEAEGLLTDLGKYLRAGRMTELPVSVAHALRAGSLPGPHRDPFDRMLIAQAQLEQLTVVTTDPVFAQYGAPVAW